MDGFESKSSRKKARYVVNGQEYFSLDEMPPEVRKLFEDNNGDGQPDWLGAPLGRSMSYSTSESFELRTVNGVTTYRVGDVQYASLEEMPPEHRKLFEDRDRDGLPDGFPKLGRMVSELGQGPPSLSAGRSGKSAKVVRQSSTRLVSAPGGEGHFRPIRAPRKLHADTVFLMILGVVVVLAIALAILLVGLLR